MHEHVAEVQILDSAPSVAVRLHRRAAPLQLGVGEGVCRAGTVIVEEQPCLGVRHTQIRELLTVRTYP